MFSQAKGPKREIQIRERDRQRERTLGVELNVVARRLLAVVHVVALEPVDHDLHAPHARVHRQRGRDQLFVAHLRDHVVDDHLFGRLDGHPHAVLEQRVHQTPAVALEAEHVFELSHGQRLIRRSDSLREQVFGDTQVVAAQELELGEHVEDVVVVGAEFETDVEELLGESERRLFLGL